ncbi:MAG: AMP-binding protein [Actinobacteria bacterium]|nr:AMP-binding protein [Actinomycetota bacterium]
MSRTLGEILATRAAESPDHAIVRFEDAVVTYADLDAAANRVANGLGALGLERGDRAAVMLSNRPEFLATWFGMAKAGIVEVPLNTGLRGDMLAYMLNQAECRALVIDEQWLERIERIAPSLATLRDVVVVPSTSTESTPRATDLPGALSTRSWADLLDAPSTAPEVEIDPFDRSVILFTSGTTGPSKGAVLTHNAHVAQAQNVCDLMRYGPGETLFNAFPLFHVNARYTSVLPAMLLDGGSLVLHDRFSASRFWEICRAESVTAFNFMGAMVMMLQKQPERPDDADNPVRCAYGAPAPVAIQETFQERFGLELVEVYGSTELCCATQNTLAVPHPRGSCGRASPLYEVEIHDEHGHRLPPGVEGEIVVRPREPHAMVEEYVGNPEATVAAFRGCWFHTGDRGRVDENGWFFFSDRLKDAIRRRGENISSWELEQVLNDHEAVEETAVIGVPSELTEEEVLAVVKLKEGAALAPEALLDFAQERVPHFAVPRYVRFVAELPKNHAQRIEKPVLRAVGVTPDTWDRELHGYEVRR